MKFLEKKGGIKMKKTKKKQGHHNSIFEEKGEVGHFLRNHNASVQDCPVNPSRSVLNLFLLFKLIYAGVIYSIMIYKSDLSSVYKIAGGLFGFMLIAANIHLEDCIQGVKSKIAKPIYGAKTFIIMVAYAVYILCCCILRYDNQMDNMELLFILTLMSITNEVLQIVDCVYSEQKNYTKLSGFKYTWMILLPILLTLQIYGNLPFKYVTCFILINILATVGAEITSMLFLSGIFPGYYIY